MFRKIGHRYIAFDAANEGGTGGGGDAHPVAPWGSEGLWNVGEGEAAKPWHSFLTDEAARQHVEAKGYANPNELALANYSLTKMQRGDPSVVGVPGEGATPEDWNAFYGKLGRPDAPEGYDLKFPEGQAVDAPMLEWGKKAFHEVGLSPKQAQALAEKWQAFVGEQNTTAAGAVGVQNDTELAALETKWGADLAKTATEVMERVAEKAALLSPTMGRIQSEFLGPTIDREIDVLNELGLLPEMPPELVEAQGEYEVVYTSPLAKSMYAEEVSGFMRSVETSLNIAQATQDMSALDHYNFDVAIPEMADYMAVPSRWMASLDDIKAKREARTQQAETQQMIDAAPAAASVAKTVQGGAAK